MTRTFVFALVASACTGTTSEVLTVPVDPNNSLTADVIQVTAGEDHTCALNRDGSIACWGRNTDGRATPPYGAFTSISAGIEHTCALRTDGTIACWGGDEFGEADPPPGQFKAVTAGQQYTTCAIRLDDTVQCWGNVEAPAPDGTFVAISPPCGNTGAGTIACWGDQGTTAAPPSGQFVAISVGLDGIDCALGASGAITCWQPVPDGQPPTPPANAYQAVAEGDSHGCGIASDGSLACWTEPDDLDGSATPPAGKYISISSSEWGTCAVSDEGSVACWPGSDPFGAMSPPPVTRP